MNTATTLQIESPSSEQTEQLGERLGHNLRGGEVIELVSDVGGGKTTFVRGLAKGLGSRDAVSSPSFMIEQVYKAGGHELHHFDFYRLNDPGVVATELAEVLDDPKNIVVIEWAKSVHNVLPNERLKISFKTIDDIRRHTEFTAPPQLSYLLEGLK